MNCCEDTPSYILVHLFAFGKHLTIPQLKLFSSSTPLLSESIRNQRYRKHPQPRAIGLARSMSRHELAALTRFTTARAHRTKNKPVPSDYSVPGSFRHEPNLAN